MEHRFLQNYAFNFFNATQKIILMQGIKCVFGILKQRPEMKSVIIQLTNNVFT